MRNQIPTYNLYTLGIYFCGIFDKEQYLFVHFYKGHFVLEILSSWDLIERSMSW
jgi:hypothetical protein